MNRSNQINGFKDDTWINGIGSLYRKKGATKWGINLSIHPKGDNGKDSTTLSNAPVLVRKRKINPTYDYYFKESSEKSFAIPTTRGWSIDLIGNCPARDQLVKNDAREYCFVFSLADGITVYLPQFELARMLFFKNGYLARTALEHDLLNIEYSPEYDEENDRTIINVSDSFSGSKELFSDNGFRRLFAWILMDPEARRSYDSIGAYQLSHGYDVGQYRCWNFRFDPPALEDARMKVKGYIDTDSRTMLVHEIIGLRYVPMSVSERVAFYHPSFYAQVSGNGQGNGSDANRPPGHNVDDTSEGSQENKPVVLEGYATEFELDRAIETSKICEKKKPTDRGRKDDEEPGEASSDVSTEEQGPNGDLPSADWDNMNDQTDDAHLYLNKFTSYFKMLGLLEEKHCCRVIKYELRKLPIVGKCKKHVVEPNKEPRCMSVAHVTAGTTGYYLLEVDTSDAAKALSTRVIRASAIGDIEPHLSEIEIQLMKASLSWPKEHLDKLVGANNHIWVPHQKSKKGGALTTEHIEKWATRFLGYFSR